jgi:D-3-phosphoglycerate dehydrogenase
MIRILANDGIDDDGKMLLEEAEYEVITDHIPQEELAKALPGFDVLIVRSATKVRKELIDLCPRLKIIARGGVGMDNIDVEYAVSKGIEVINTPQASTRSVAELTMGHIFALSRFLHRSKADMTGSKSDFKKLKAEFGAGHEIAGKVLGILGFGRIGQETAKLAMGAGLRILPYDPYVSETVLNFDIFDNANLNLALNVHTVELETVLAKSDFISLHLPLTNGQSVITKSEINKMKEGVIIINCARGGVIDEDALLEGLNTGKIGGAGLDVFMNEPTPNKAILDHPNVSISPHIGGSTIEAQAKIGRELADKIITFLED